MAGNPPIVMIVSGEASGDMHGACLAAQLKRMVPGIELRGVGGRKMREAGVDLIFDSSSWSAIGVTEAWKLIPSLLNTKRKLKAHLRANPPDLLVLIDFGAFNVRLAQSIRGSGIKVLYYFPPGSWRRGSTHNSLSGIVDRIITPFPWSAESLREQGFKADFFGHPLLDVVKPSLSRGEFCASFGLDPDRPIIGLLPGSRKQELKYNLPAILMGAGKLVAAMPELQFAIPLASSIDPNKVLDELNDIPWLRAAYHGDAECRSSKPSGGLPLKAAISKLAVKEKFVPPARPVELSLLPGMAWDILAYSRAAVTASGTATVEAMILGCPMVIIYRGSPITALEYKLRKEKLRIPYIGMPNIISERMICPEYIGEDASPRTIYEAMSKLIPDSQERKTMLQDLAAAKAVLGNPGAVEKTAAVALDMIGIKNG